MVGASSLINMYPFIIGIIIKMDHDIMEKFEFTKSAQLKITRKPNGLWHS